MVMEYVIYAIRITAKTLQEMYAKFQEFLIINTTGRKLCNCVHYPCDS